MVKGVIAQAGGLHSNPEHLLELALADVIAQAPRPKTFITAAITLRSRGFWGHQAFWSRRLAAAAGGLYRHGSRLRTIHASA